MTERSKDGIKFSLEGVKKENFCGKQCLMELALGINKAKMY
jgi:hypothetical protein